MSEHTDPIWTLFLWLGLLALIAYILVNRLVVALAWLERRNAECDQQAAADHGEPTREQVEQTWWPFDNEQTAMPPSLARFIAEHAADDIDDEWRRICEVTGGAA